MDYEIDPDPARSVIRLTVTAETVTPEMAEEIYRHLSEATSSGGRTQPSMTYPHRDARHLLRTWSDLAVLS